MSIVWACCSSKRADSILSKTIRTLERGGFIGTLFLVVPHDEVAVYVKALEEAPISVVVQGSPKGLVKQRQTLRNQWPPGQEIVFIDDDVTAIKVWNDGKLKHCQRLHDLVDACFSWAATYGGNEVQTEEGQCLLWGVYPICNALFMKPRMSLNNTYIVGAFYGCINDPRLKEPEIDELEDYGRQLSEQAAGRTVIRYNWIGVETKYFKNPGGMQQARNPATRLAAVQAMAEWYPGLVKSYNRKDGTPDLKFLKKPEYQEQWARVADSVISAPDSVADQSTAAILEDVQHEPPSLFDLQSLQTDRIHLVSGDPGGPDCIELHSAEET